jgi:hypothetical protein
MIVFDCQDKTDNPDVGLSPRLGSKREAGYDKEEIARE